MPLTPVVPGSLTLSPTSYSQTVTITVTDSSVDALDIKSAAGTTLFSIDGNGYVTGGLIVGNDGSTNYGPNTGTPSGNVIPIKFQQTIGTAGTTVKQSTQLVAMWAKYKERVADDSAEAGSCGVILTDAYGGFASPQTLPAVGWEGDCLIQGAVTLSNKAIGVVGGVQVQNTAHADSAMHFYAAQTNVAAGATVTNRYGYYDEGTTGAGAITNKWSAYGKLRFQTEHSIVIGVVGASAFTGTLWVQNPSADVVTIAVVAQSGQSAALTEWRDSANNVLCSMAVGGALQMTSTPLSNTKVGITTGGAGNSAIVARAANAQTADIQIWQSSTPADLFSITAAGLPRWVAAGNQQTTVGAAGAASALPATPTKYLKIVDSAGTTLVVPAYAAS